MNKLQFLLFCTDGQHLKDSFADVGVGGSTDVFIDSGWDTFRLI